MLDSKNSLASFDALEMCELSISIHAYIPIIKEEEECHEFERE